MALSRDAFFKDVSDRFGIAQDAPPADIEERQRVQKELRNIIADAGTYLSENVAEGREASLALTKLEEALMWAGKAIFKD